MADRQGRWQTAAREAEDGYGVCVNQTLALTGARGDARWAWGRGCSLSPTPPFSLTALSLVILLSLSLTQVAHDDLVQEARQRGRRL